MKKVLKSILGLCLAVTVLFGSGIQAKAAQSNVEWSEGWSYIFQDGDGFWFSGTNNEPVAIYKNDELSGSGLDSYLTYENGIRYAVCKFTPEGEKGLYLYNYIPAAPIVPAVPAVPAAPTAPESNAPSCSDHNYEWVTTREATATVAGEKAYQCTKCSHIESYAEVSGYLAFNEDAMKSIKNAAANGTVTIDTKMWVSFHKSVFDTLGTRKDVAVTVNFKHEGKNYTTTIPAGADLTGLTDEKGFCGFLNLMAKFGGSEIVK